jgi:phosphatidylglycerophosphatase C
MTPSRAAVASPGIALFDLDGTLTRRDTLLPYLLGFLARHPRRWPGLWRAAPALLGYPWHRDRGRLKSQMIRTVLGGEDRATVAAWSARFVRQLEARHAFHRQALAILEAHRAAGDRLVLLSASPDLYVPQIGAALGFDQVLCTQVRWQGDRLDGALLSANRRGPEKVRCLQALRREHPDRTIVAYGNSEPDLAHLELADRGVLVNAPRALRQRALRGRIVATDWE